MKKNDGNPAFPSTPFALPHEKIESHMGISKRDYFAAAALPALIALGHSSENAAYFAYAHADKMIDESEK